MPYNHVAIMLVFVRMAFRFYTISETSFRFHHPVAICSMRFDIVTGLSLSQPSISEPDGLRPINLRTDLAQLADLIELVFASSMDASGRAAIREMRYLSKMGIGLSVLSSMGEMGGQSHNMGYVWIANGRLVGNVSVYGTGSSPGMEAAWIIANVGVHPDYQRRGIARRLMQASIDMIHHRGGKMAVLQVDEDNDAARALYQSLGFVDERVWTQWYRSEAYHPPPIIEMRDVHIAHRRPNEWQAEYALAQQVRPQQKGGMGWLRPLHPHLFRDRWWRRLLGWLSFSRTERFVIRDDTEQQILASLWVETKIGGSRAQLSLMTAPEYLGVYDKYLLHLAARRFGGRAALLIDHPADEEATSAILRHLHFRPRRTVVNMRLDL